MSNKPLIFTVIATLLFAALAYFGFSPDLAVAADLSDAAKKAADAIAMRNYILAGEAIIALGALVYNWIKGSNQSGSALFLIVAISATAFVLKNPATVRQAHQPVSFVHPTSPGVTITVVKDLPRLLPQFQRGDRAA